MRRSAILAALGALSALFLSFSVQAAPRHHASKAVWNCESFLDLDKKSPLRKQAERLNTKWSDNNITTGTSIVKVSRLDPSVDLESRGELAQNSFRSAFFDRFDERFPENIGVKVSSTAFERNDVAFAASALNEGNAGSDHGKEFKAQFRRDIRKLIVKLGDESKILTLKTTAHLANNGDTEDMRYLYSILFINLETREMVQIFVVEGHR